MPKRSAAADGQTESKSKKTKTSTSPDATSDMAASQATKRILVIGLAHLPKSAAMAAGAKQMKGQFRQMILDTVAGARESGLELEIMQVKAAAFSSGLKDVRQRLESKSFDGVVIGNGIRAEAEYTVFFEDLVNACREMKPEMRMGFNTSPSDILECCLRNFK